MNLTSVSVYDLPACYALARASLAGRRWTPRGRLIARICLCVVFALIATLDLILPHLLGEDAGFARFLAVALYILTGLILFGTVYVYALAGRVIYRSLRKMGRVTNTFVCGSESVYVVSQSDAMEGSVTIPYARLHHAVETKDYILLYQNAGSAFVLDKRTLTGGAPEELRNAIRQHMTGRYTLSLY